MQGIKNGVVVLISAFLITILFYKQSLGINLFIFEFLAIGHLYVSKQFELKGINLMTCLLGVILTATFSVIHHSLLSYVTNFIMFFIFIGVVMAPEIRSLTTAIVLSLSNAVVSQKKFLSQWFCGERKKGSRVFPFFKRTRIILIPILILLFFILVYSWSSPKFKEIISSIGNSIQDSLDFIFGQIEFGILLTFFLGLIISNFIILRVRNDEVVSNELLRQDALVRTKSKLRTHVKMLGLKNEYSAGLFLFFGLNLLLLLLNIIDVRYVWFDFEWEGQYLKQFVHQGTYFLILSILVSIVLVLYFFRNNLNFFQGNKWLEYLCYIWIFQNAILVVSVSLRNLYYINHFAMAYKRIAIVFFLLLALYGLYAVFVKVRNKKSTFYLIRTNFYAFLLVLIFSSAFNWDQIIAKYNFRNSASSFVHLNFLAELSDSALPELDKPLDLLTKMNIQQSSKYSFLSSSDSFSRSTKRLYMTPEDYFVHIQKRKKQFKKKWESKSWLSWNWAESRAYDKMFD